MVKPPVRFFRQVKNLTCMQLQADFVEIWARFYETPCGILEVLVISLADPQRGNGVGLHWDPRPAEL